MDLKVEYADGPGYDITVDSTTVGRLRFALDVAIEHSGETLSAQLAEIRDALESEFERISAETLARITS